VVVSEGIFSRSSLTAAVSKTSDPYSLSISISKLANENEDLLKKFEEKCRTLAKIQGIIQSEIVNNSAFWKEIKLCAEDNGLENELNESLAQLMMCTDLK